MIVVLQFSSPKIRPVAFYFTHVLYKCQFSYYFCGYSLVFNAIYKLFLQSSVYLFVLTLCHYFVPSILMFIPLHFLSDYNTVETILFHFLGGLKTCHQGYQVFTFLCISCSSAFNICMNCIPSSLASSLLWGLFLHHFKSKLLVKICLLPPF